MRDVIRVERVAESLDGAPGAPTIEPDALAAVGRVADEVLPSLVARLAVSGLGELEVRHGGWRVRVRRSLAPVDAAAGGPGSAEPGSGAAEPASGGQASGRASDVATSPAVGYFSPRPELGVGARVGQGDVIGSVDVLGIRHEVAAPIDGLVGKWFVGPGDPVEYGQELVQLVPGGASSAQGGSSATPGQEGSEA